MPVTIQGVEGLRSKANTALGATEWETMTFERIQAFADATGDQQWIHVDRERIAKESPFGAPIAHGYFTLSLVAGRFFDLLDLQGMGMVINYGTNKCASRTCSRKMPGSDSRFTWATSPTRRVASRPSSTPDRDRRRAEAGPRRSACSASACPGLITLRCRGRRGCSPCSTRHQVRSVSHPPRWITRPSADRPGAWMCPSTT